MQGISDAAGRRLEAWARLMEDGGHMTPYATMTLRRIINEEQEDDL